MDKNLKIIFGSIAALALATIVLVLGLLIYKEHSSPEALLKGAIYLVNYPDGSNDIFVDGGRIGIEYGDYLVAEEVSADTGYVYAIEHYSGSLVRYEPDGYENFKKLKISAEDVLSSRMVLYSPSETGELEISFELAVSSIIASIDLQSVDLHEVIRAEVKTETEIELNVDDPATGFIRYSITNLTNAPIGSVALDFNIENHNATLSYDFTKRINLYRQEQTIAILPPNRTIEVTFEIDYSKLNGLVHFDDHHKLTLYAYSSPLNSKEAVLISEDMVVLVSNKLKQERTQSGLKVLYPNEPTEITSGDESYYITVPGGTYIRTDSRGCTSVFFPDYKSGLKIFPSSDPAVCYMPPLQGNCSEGSGQIYRIPIPILVRDYNFIPSFLHCDKVSESHPVPDTVYVEEFWAIDDEHEYGFGLFFLDTTSSYYYAIAANSQQIEAVLNSFNKR